MLVFLLLLSGGYSTLRSNKIIVLFTVLGMAPFLFHYCVQSMSDDAFPYEVLERSLTIQAVSGSDVFSWGTKTTFLIVDNNSCAESEGCFSWQDKKIQLNDYQEGVYVKGCSYKAKVRLKPPIGLSNPGGFDYEHWLFSKKIWAVGYVKGEVTPLSCNLSVGWFDRLQEKLASQAQGESLRQVRSLGLVKALLFGNKSGIVEQDKDLLSSSGLIHLFVISGLHVGLLFGVLLIFSRLSLLGCQAILGSKLSWFAGVLSEILTVACVWWYVTEIALPVSAVRAAIFISIWRAVRVFSYQTTIWQVLGGSFWLILAMWPEQVVSLGFWMSFLAIVGLILPFWGRGRGNNGTELKSSWLKRFFLTLRRYFWTLLKLQLSVSFILLPVLIWMQGAPVSLAALWNLLLIPLFSVFVVPSLVVACVIFWWSESVALWLFKLLGSLLVGILDCVSDSVQWLNHMNLDLNYYHPSVAVFVFAVCALMPLGLVYRAFGVLAVVFIILLGRDESAHFEVWFLDVGQAQSVVITRDRRAMIYDVGFKFGNFNASDAVVIPFLGHKQVKVVDHVFISHSDSDHSGGLEALLDSRYRPDTLHANYQSDLLSLLGGQVKSCSYGDGLSWQGSRIEVLWPNPQSKLHNELMSNNDTSCVIRLEYGNHSLLLVGDISVKVEKELIAMAKKGDVRLSSDILSMPHHGSKSSSSMAFIQEVSPSWVVASSGALNRYGHPSKVVVERYRNAGVEVLNTAVSGAIRFDLENQDGLSPPLMWRTLKESYWTTNRKIGL
ncbi:ComEC family protein [Litoribacillus peritrichatus]|uniref:ComEC family protein n=1 Tax=Litoribacillus peritrichatus TaxID=718191 RepID=A0ABP7N414_9GAMM